MIETVGFDDADSGNDTIYGSPFNDILFGGGGDDVIYGFGGNDLIFGDQGKVSCAPGTPYDPDNPLNGVCVDLGGAIVFIATNTTTLDRLRQRPDLRGRRRRHRLRPAGQRRPLRRATATTS